MAGSWPVRWVDLLLLLAPDSWRRLLASSISRILSNTQPLRTLSRVFDSTASLGWVIFKQNRVKSMRFP